MPRPCLAVLQRGDTRKQHQAVDGAAAEARAEALHLAEVRQVHGSEIGRRAHLTGLKGHEKPSETPPAGIPPAPGPAPRSGQAR